jgi:hypothetical protein
MNTHEILSAGSRLTFFLLTFLSIRMGDGFGIFLTLAVFLIMENFIEELKDSEVNK